jgi:predicted TIM-barrel fold metal-dependent hydrolase
MAGVRQVKTPVPRIDIHCHAFPEAVLKHYAAAYPEKFRLERRRESGTLVAVWAGAGVPLPAFILEERLAAIEQDGVALEVLSAPTPVYAEIDDKTAEFCTALNEFQANLAERHPSRFRSFIHLPVHDLKATRAELRRWKDHPMTVGIVLGSNVGGIYPGDSRFIPVWEEIATSQLAVFIHPLSPCGAPNVIPAVIFDFVNDTAVAAATIIYSGLLVRFPELKIILAHYGGAMPYHLRRLDLIDHPHFPRSSGKDLPRRPSEYVSHFYVDTAQGFHRPSFECAKAVFGIDRLLYGSDYFFLDSPFRVELNSFFEALPLSEAERQAIFQGNARRVLRGI